MEATAGGPRASSSDLAAFVAPLVAAGRVVSLAQALVKLTAPGVPDSTRAPSCGTLSLVDPDNRRPVDFEARRQKLAELKDGATAEAVLAAADDGAPKLWLTWHALQVRRRFPEAFGPEGGYEPLVAEGRRSEHVLGFLRGGRVATVVPRFPLRLAGNWQSTTVVLPEGDWKNHLTGEAVRGGAAPVTGLFQRFPVALLSLG